MIPCNDATGETPMKKRLGLLLALLTAVLCTGCAWMESHYESIRPHQVLGDGFARYSHDSL